MARPDHWAGPRAYIEDKPTSQTISFGGRLINASKLARDIEVDRSHVSRVLSGQKIPSIPCEQKIADAFGIDILELRYWIVVRKEEMAEYNRRLLA